MVAIFDDKHEPLSDSLAKRMAAFFKISFSSRGRLFSAFSKAVLLLDVRLLCLPLPGNTVSLYWS